MEGVAHTFGTQSHKEIHFSLDHIVNSKNRAREEIRGVLVHEVVHCYQYNALDTCPGGLIEGIAGTHRIYSTFQHHDTQLSTPYLTDFVRLHEGLEPPHWKRVHTGEWDAGYQTTAYFLDWIELRYGEGTIRELNECMKERKYHRRVFKELTGRPVRKLWKIYCTQLAATEVPGKPAFKAVVDGETKHGGGGDPRHLIGEDSDSTAVEGDTRRLVGEDSDNPAVDENTKSEGEGDNWLVIDKQPDL